MEYYYSDGQNQFGPVSLEDLRTKIDANTLVWHDGMPGWDKASNVEELKAMFARPTPPPPPIVQQTPMQQAVSGSVKKKDVGLLVMAIVSMSVCISFAIINIILEGGGHWESLISIYVLAFSIVAIVKSIKPKRKTDVILLVLGIIGILGCLFDLIILIGTYYTSTQVYSYMNDPVNTLYTSFWLTFSIYAIVKAFKKR